MNTTTSIRHCSICGQPGHRRESHERPDSKRCYICHQILPVAAFRIRTYHGKEAGHGHYYDASCVACGKARNKARYRQDFGTRFTYLLQSMRTHSQKKGLECTVDLPYLHYLFEQQQGRCYYSNLELSLETGDYAISVDRRDPAQGYVPDNIVLCCWLVNNMKRRLTEQQFLDLCQQIFQHRQALSPL